MEIVKKNFTVKYNKEYQFDIDLELKIYDRSLYQDVPNLTDEIYWNHAVNIGYVIILLKGIKVNNILSDDVRDKIYIRVRKEINKYIKSKL
jgi:hypothetical protein